MNWSRKSAVCGRSFELRGPALLDVIEKPSPAFRRLPAEFIDCLFFCHVKSRREISLAREPATWQKHPVLNEALYMVGN